MKGKVNCTCGWSWNKSDSSKKDMYVCHECGRDNSNNMQNGGWLDSYANGGTMQEHQENYNDSTTTAPQGYVGDGYSNVGRNYSPAWGGSFQEGGEIPQAQNGGLTFLQPTSDKLPQGYRIPYADPSSERAMSIGGEDGEPAYLIPTFKHGEPIYNAIEEFRKTGEHLGGPFKTWQEAEKWESETRHPAVEKGEKIMFPQEKFQMGGSMPGAVGFSYARTQGAAPSNGPYAKKTKASAQNGQEMKFYQEGLDWKPKSISREGSVIKDDRGQWDHPGEITRISGGNITMKKDPKTGKALTEPLLGIADTGEQQWMYPGEDYNFEGAKHVTEYPIAQDDKTFIKNVDSSLQYQKDWMNSPRYKEMLNKSTENDWIDRGYAEDRLKNLEDLIKSKSYNIRKSDDEYGPIGEEANSNPNTGVINIYKGGRQPGEEEENISHEISHGTDKPRLGMIPFRDRLIPQSDINLIEKYKPSTYKETGAYLRATPEGKASIEKYNLLNQKDINYKTEPTETRARLNVIRQYAKENNIYDPFKQKITPRSYEKLFKNKDNLPQGAMDLRSIYTKDELINLLNTVSQNDNQDDHQNITVAKNGIRQEQKGLQNLDNLVNFTNYNKPQPGGWLSKYE